MTLFETQIGTAQSAFPNFNIRTWLFDPPYNVNFKYGDKVKDNLNEVDYHNLILLLVHYHFELQAYKLEL